MYFIDNKTDLERLFHLLKGTEANNEENNNKLMFSPKQMTYVQIESR